MAKNKDEKEKLLQLIFDKTKEYPTATMMSLIGVCGGMVFFISCTGIGYFIDLRNNEIKGVN